MSASFFAASVFAFLPALVPALVVARSPWLALALSPVLTALCAAVAGIVAVLLRVPTLVPFAVVVLALNGAAVRALRHELVSIRWREQLLPGLVIVGVAVYAMTPLRRWAVDFDTRVVWFAHARWFFRGGDYVWRYLPTRAFAHTDYPPLTPALVGLLWRVQGHVDPRSGQLVIGLINFGALCVVGLGFPRVFPRRLRAMPTVAGAVVVLGAVGFAGPFTTDGYADPFWAACIGAAVLYLLIAPTRFDNVLIGFVALCAAALTKNEGTSVALVVGALAVVRHRRDLRRAPMLLSFFPLALVWPVTVRVHGAHGEYKGATVGALLTGDSGVWNHLGPTMSALWHYSGVALVVAAMCSAAGLVVAHKDRLRAGIASTLYSWAAIAATFVIIAGAYMVDTLPLTASRSHPVTLHMHLASSVDRTTIALRLLLLIETMTWVLYALLAFRRQQSRRWSSERPDETPISAHDRTITSSSPTSSRRPR